MEEKPIITTNWQELSPLLSDCLEQHVDVMIPITGTSMLPLLREGQDRVLLTATENGILKKGDIALYRRKNSQYVLHRVTAVEEDCYTMLGDNQTKREPGIEPGQILAVVKGIYRGDEYRPCTHRGYRLYVRLWMALVPVRPLLLRGYRWGRRIRRGRT